MRNLQVSVLTNLGGASRAARILRPGGRPCVGYISLTGSLASVIPGEGHRGFAKREFDLHRPEGLAFPGEPRGQGETCNLIPLAQPLLPGQNSPEVRLGHPEVPGEHRKRQSLLAQKPTQVEGLHGYKNPAWV
jgi:hypothetical protein